MGLTLAGVCAVPRGALAQNRSPSAEERKRRELLERLGLDKAETPPAPPAPPSPPPSAPAAAPADEGPATKSAPDGRAKAPVSPPKPDRVFFNGAVHDGLVRACRGCHSGTGMLAKSRFALSGDGAQDYASARALVNVSQPEQSLLLTKAAGVAHGGRAIYVAGSAPHRLLLRWIADGAASGGRGAAAVSATAAPAPALPATPGRRPRGEPPASALAIPRGDAIGAVPPFATPPLPGALAVPGAPDGGTPGSTSTVAGTPPAAVGLPSSPAPVTYATDIHPLVQGRCVPCHAEGGMAATTRYLLVADVERDFQSARSLVDLQRAEASALVVKAEGTGHAGGPVFLPGSAEHTTLIAWIKAGALKAPAPALVAGDVAGGASAVAGAPVPGAAPQAGPPAATDAAPITTIGSAPAVRPSAAYRGLPLPLGLRLNGRFDLNYERRSFQDHPFTDGAVNALANYHRFVFLSRDSGVQDPFGFTAELMSLEFWEAHMRLGPRQPGAPWRLWIKVGKLLIPFGAEPLFHQRYGGHAGFDQRVVPIIWAQPGARAQLLVTHKRLSVTVDLYAVNGHALRESDGVLNLQNDFSPLDDVRVALGQRVGFSWGALTGWYSAYTNGLGFGRRLFLQAADLGVARWRGLPVLDRFSASVGLLRADVSGGGSGADYYHFASYAQLRFFPCDFVYLQYRQGMRTFNNRRGLIQDGTRLAGDDGSTHNFEVVGRYYGATVGLGYFFNLERANETADDLFRVTVAYEF